MAFTLDVQRRGTMATIRLSGELDMAVAPRLRDLIEAVVRDGQPFVLLGLDQLSFCDSAGLNAFVQGDRHCAGHGGWLRLAGATGHVARVLDLSGVGEILAYQADPT
jgi:anti-anti-sigma factor